MTVRLSDLVDPEKERALRALVADFPPADDGNDGELEAKAAGGGGKSGGKGKGKERDRMAGGTSSSGSDPFNRDGEGQFAPGKRAGRREGGRSAEDRIDNPRFNRDFRDRNDDDDSVNPTLRDNGLRRVGSLDDVDEQVGDWADVPPRDRARQKAHLLKRAESLGASAAVLAKINRLPAPKAEEKADEMLELKASGELERKADPGLGGAQVLSADDDTGRVIALVSVTGVEDRVKDVIEPGAYTKTIAKHEPIGVWSHDDKTWVARTEHAVELMPGDPFLAEMKTMDGQPWPAAAGAVKVEALFNLETTHGREAYSDVKFFQGKTGWSIGYRATKAHRNPRTGVRHIKELDWFEYSPVMVGAASQPMTLSVKSYAAPVDPDEGIDLVDVEQLTDAEVKARGALREWLETKARKRVQRVRTAAGVARYKQPIGTVIISDSIRAEAIKINDVIDGKVGDTTVDGRVTKVSSSGGKTSLTVQGDDGKSTDVSVSSDTVVEVQRAEAGGAAAGAGGDGSVLARNQAAAAKRIEGLSDTDLDAALDDGDAQGRNTSRAYQMLVAERAKRDAAKGKGKDSGSGGGGGGAAPAGGDKTGPEAADAALGSTDWARVNDRDAEDAIEGLVEQGWKQSDAKDAVESLIADAQPDSNIAKRRSADSKPPAKAGEKEPNAKGEEGSIRLVDAIRSTVLPEAEKEKVRKLIRDQDYEGAAAAVEKVGADRVAEQIRGFGNARRSTAFRRAPGAVGDQPKPKPDTTPPAKTGDDLAVSAGLTGGEVEAAIKGSFNDLIDRDLINEYEEANDKAASDGDDTRSGREAQVRAEAARKILKARGIAYDDDSDEWRFGKRGRLAGVGETRSRNLDGSDEPIRTGGTPAEKEDGPARDRHLSRLHAEADDDELVEALSIYEEDLEDRPGDRRATMMIDSIRDEQDRRRRVARDARALVAEQADLDKGTVRYKEIEAILRRMAGRKSLGPDVAEHGKLAALNVRRRRSGRLPLDALPVEAKHLDLDVLEYYNAEVKGSTASLARSPKQNWIEKVGGELPPYVREVARGVMRESGKTESAAIPIAIGRIKVWARGGDGVKPDTVAKAGRALAQWEALKAKAGTKYDSVLMAELEQKALDHEDACDDAWAFLYEAGELGEVKAQVGTSADYVQVDGETGEVLGTATVEPLSADELGRLAELKSLL